MHRQLFFETHATSIDNEAGRASGWDDVALSARGEEQARALGARYEAGALAAVYCSDLQRSRRSAEIAFADSRVPIVVDARLRECDYGRLTGADVSRIDELRAAAIETPFPDGESYRDVVRRVRACLVDIVSLDDPRAVLIVGHRATFYAVEHLLNARPLAEVVSATWRWQPGWAYVLPAAAEKWGRV